ncbi:MAG: hypothetical protein FWE11_06730 [Defluviitaleaceae bacterium]|nr:hypothetical protein [Defluviitaleaceae bacterium]
MSQHQIIFTSCKRGIDGIGDGQQMYSYNEDFKDSNADNIKSFFSYHVPSLPFGEIMTEEKAKTMPQAFEYKRLTNNNCAIALKTYLGRDYMGATGRFGNFMSHVVISPVAELAIYPAELYQSGLLRAQMDFEEVNSTDTPPFLPTPDITPGRKVTLETVITFLDHENRMATYKNMLAAMFQYKSARKRVVICDYQENTIMWIAALHYALPLEMALGVNFTTYEHDPNRSQFQICGVVPQGTSYGATAPNAHFTFDFINNVVPDVKAVGNFYDFLDIGNILDFHNFIANKLSLINANEDYPKAYNLFSFLAEGFSNLSLGAFTDAVHIAEEYGNEKIKIEIINEIANQKDFIAAADEDYALEIITVALAMYPKVDIEIQKKIKSLIVERILATFAIPTITKEDFNKQYGYLCYLCKKTGLNIFIELVNDENIGSLLAMVKNSEYQWQWDFVVEMLCDYAIDQKLSIEDLSMDHKLGRQIGEVLTERLDADTNSGFVLITRIISRFSDNWEYLANIALNIEGIILDAPDKDELLIKHWKYTYNMLAAEHSRQRQNIYNLFLSLDRKDQAFDMYSTFISKAANVKAATEIFKEHISLKNNEYLQEYLLQIYDHYFIFIAPRKESAATSAKRDLLKLITKKGVVPDFTHRLIEEILEDISLSFLSRDDTEMVISLLDYFRGQRAEDTPYRLVLLATGMLVTKARSAYELDNAIKAAIAIATTDTIELGNLTGIEIDKYFAWVVPTMFSCSKSCQDLITSYEVFSHNSRSSGSFIDVCAYESLRASKETKEFSNIIYFLEFLFTVGSIDDRKEAGKIFCKLSKQNLASLNEIAKIEFADNKKFLLYWSEVYEVAESTNPILASIGNFFKKRKK